MKRLLLFLGALNVAWVVTSLGGVIFDTAELTFWTWNLMAALLTTVVLAPVLVFLGTRSSSRVRPVRSRPSAAPVPAPSSSPSDAPAGTERSTQPANEMHEQTAEPTVAQTRPRTTARRVVYVGSLLLLGWLFASLFGLFLDPANLSFWTRSVMWTFIATLLWAPILVFGVNPLNDPALTAPDLSPTPAQEDAEPFVAPSAEPEIPIGETAETEQDEPARAASVPSSSSPFASTKAASSPDDDWTPWPGDDTSAR